MNIVLVYNQKSGGAHSLSELKRLCKLNGIIITKALPLSDSLAQRLKPFIRRGDIIAVVGGDGSVSAVAAMIVGTKAVLAPLPGGTLNHFTKDLGVAQNIEKALGNLVHSRTKVIDVATVNGAAFVNNSSIGLYPSSLQERSKLEGFLSKWLAAIMAAGRVLVRFKVYHVTINGKKYRTPFVFVGNNRYDIDTPGVTERTRLDEGILTVFIARTTSRLAVIKIVLWALVGKSRYLDEFDREYTTKLTIKMGRDRVAVSRDGEVGHLSLPLIYSSKPKSLRVRF